MTMWSGIEETLTTSLGLARRPVAIRFADSSPGASAEAENQPAGCSFWKVAADGAAVMTEPRHHYACAIGSYTHNLPIPDDRSGELEETLSMMFDAGYLTPEDIPGIPRLEEAPAAIRYEPLGECETEPDIVLLVARAADLMLLGEAAARAGVAAALSLLARPTCMVLAAAQRDGVAASSGCIGNRVYTELGDDLLYLAVRGDLFPALVDALGTIVSANETLRAHHLSKKSAWESSRPSGG